MPPSIPRLTPIRLMVGLGNPGSQYEGTRHNCGFQFLDEYARQVKQSFSLERRFQGELARVGEMWLLKPITWMNRSGEAVATLSSFYKISPLETLIIHDELDIKPGELRLKQGGGSAGHNGIKSIVQCWGNADFFRLRIGIGHPRDSTILSQKKQAVADFVLQSPNRSEQTLIESAVLRALNAVPYLQRGEMGEATRLLHTLPASSLPQTLLPGQSNKGTSTA